MSRLTQRILNAHGPGKLPEESQRITSALGAVLDEQLSDPDTNSAEAIAAAERAFMQVSQEIHDEAHPPAPTPDGHADAFADGAGQDSGLGIADADPTSEVDIKQDDHFKLAATTAAALEDLAAATAVEDQAVVSDNTVGQSSSDDASNGDGVVEHPEDHHPQNGMNEMDNYFNQANDDSGKDSNQIDADPEKDDLGKDSNRDNDFHDGGDEDENRDNDFYDGGDEDENRDNDFYDGGDEDENRDNDFYDNPAANADNEWSTYTETNPQVGDTDWAAASPKLVAAADAPPAAAEPEAPPALAPAASPKPSARATPPPDAWNPPNPDPEQSFAERIREKLDGALSRVKGGDRRRTRWLVGGAAAAAALTIAGIVSLSGGRGEPPEPAGTVAAPPVQTENAAAPPTTKSLVDSSTRVSSSCTSGGDAIAPFAQEKSRAWVCERTNGLEGAVLNITFNKPVVITEITMVPGFNYVASDGRDEWDRHRQVTGVTWRMGGQSFPRTINPTRTGATMKFPSVVTQEMSMTITATTRPAKVTTSGGIGKPGGNNSSDVDATTAISSIVIMGYPVDPAS